MTDNNNNNKPATTPATTPVTTTPATTNTTTPPTRVIGSLQVGVDTSDIKFKSVLEMRREFGDNWV